MTKYALLTIKLPTFTSNDMDDPKKKSSDKIIAYADSCKNTEFLGNHAWVFNLSSG
jgi:hypothetical protein